MAVLIVEEVGMNGMENRGAGLEGLFFHNEELRFKAEARRNRMIGLWAADKLGKSSDDAEAYVKEVIIADFEEAGDNDVVRKIMGDFKAANITVSEKELRKKMIHFFEEALAHIRDS